MRDKEKCSAGCAQMRKEIICLRQIASGTQSCQAPQRLRGWGVEVGLPTLFLYRKLVVSYKGVFRIKKYTHQKMGMANR